MKPLEVLAVELVVSLFQPLFCEALRNENEVGTVHHLPVFIKASVFVYCVVDGGAGEGGEFCHVYVVQWEVKGIFDAFVYALFRLSRKAYHKEPLDPYARLSYEAHLLPDHIEV